MTTKPPAALNFPGLFPRRHFTYHSKIQTDSEQDEAPELALDPACLGCTYTLQ
jgi:hypothetical protein